MCAKTEFTPLSWNDVQQYDDRWNLYKDLIAGIPEGIAVRDMSIGYHWVYVDAECGFGMAMVVDGGRGRFSLGGRCTQLDLRDLACYATSWNFLEASVGVAALNAWYSQPDRARSIGASVTVDENSDGFDAYRRAIQGKKVTVVGHFPVIERFADECELTVLERKPSGDDMPDSACEFIVPTQDFLFITGTTLTNKTMPRLLELSRDINTVLVGPSVVPAACLFDYGVDALAGTFVMDADSVRAAAQQGATSGVFKQGASKMHMERAGWLQ